MRAEMRQVIALSNFISEIWFMGLLWAGTKRTACSGAQGVMRQKKVACSAPHNSAYILAEANNKKHSSRCVLCCET
jgi:hypothetical protein